MYPEPLRNAPDERAVTVHQPGPLAPVPAIATALVPVQPSAVPTVASIVLPDGRVVTGYAVTPTHPAPATAKPAAVSRTAVNIALGGIGFGAVCGGLLLLTTFITALTALITQLITLAAICFGGYAAVQIFKPNHSKSGITFHIRKAVFKRNHFHG
ncbi:hypothetical protein [Streptomyces sp. NPDC047841]|uniref:hypothetical protein n=1 Tax=Streptomyces sp. NPDC047841 TaxID=3154708 RepID=UPI0034546512